MPYRTPTQKLTGDPGIFGTIGKILGTGLKVASSIIPGPFGIPARVIGGLLAPQRGTQGGTPPFVAPRLPGGVLPTGFQQFNGPRPTGAAMGPVGVLAQQPRKRRRMDPMNVKALRRATRRLAAFDREKKKVEKQLRLIAPRPARRSRRDAPPGHTHVR